VSYIFSGQQASDETMDLTAGLNVLTPPETPTRPDLMAAGNAALHQDLSGVTYLGYLVVDLHWSRWVRSEDVVGQCCLRT